MKLNKLHTSVMHNEVRTRRYSESALMIVTLIYAATVVSFEKYWVMPLVSLAAYPIFLALSIKIDCRSLFRKLLAVSPFILFVGIWNPFFDTSNIEFLGFVISRGWVSFLSILIKFILTSSSVLIVADAAGLESICRILARFGLPEQMVTHLFLFNRYIRLLSDETRNVIRARLFRGGRITLTQAGNICGPLLIRSVIRAERVRSALELRGYHGSLYNIDSSKVILRLNDISFIAIWAAYFMSIRFFDLHEILGSIIMRCVL